MPENTSIVIKDGIKSISSKAFKYCYELTNIIIPNSVTSIGEETFSFCKKLSSIILPDGITSIGGAAFLGCKKLSSIVIPDGITSIGNLAFRECENLSSIVLPDGITSIGNDAFSGCKKLSSIILPDGITSIGDGAFAGCEKLSSIVLPDSITSIGSYAFSGCSLSSIVLPKGIKSIGMHAFINNDNLTDVYCWAVVPPFLAPDGTFGYSYQHAIFIHVPKGCKEVYEQIPGWSKYTIIDDLDASGNEKVKYASGVYYADEMLHWGNANAAVQVSIYTCDGKYIQSYSNADGGDSCDLSTLPAGTYVIRVKDGNEESAFKIIR